MTKLGTIEFDDCILDALRDDKLVVFAGAGVSMGPPSNLDSFWKLACGIARGTGVEPSDPLDRFLGQLQHRKVAVHERAAELLSPPGSAPNALHHDLLRLFRAAERVRLVTTNFDLHFETAAGTLFATSPETYRAPALPLGNDFTGIVHVHGALPRARDLVLTDADFGRAYLTEGWARRFLVDVFRRYTVLFVGYSHTDVVMNYLARALPAEGVAGRFALTDEDGSWDLLGIKPIRFNKTTGADTYEELYDGVKKLAARATRGTLDWQSRMAEIGGGAPPADEESIGEVEQALRQVPTTGFLTKKARHAEWPKWLNARKHLDALFGADALSERDKLLVEWLAQHFAIEHPEAIFELVAAHGMRLHPFFWRSIGYEFGDMKGKALEESALKRWVTILLASAPTQADNYVLLCLAQRCANQGGAALTLKLFLSMCEYRLAIKPRVVWNEGEEIGRSRGLDADFPLRTDHYSLNEVWTRHLRPHMASIAQPLLSGIARQLEDMHCDFTVWDKVCRAWDPVGWSRSAIEPHDQDRRPAAIDVLIDAARDALEWLADNLPALLDAWIERLISSEIPLLRRLAIHAITVHPGKSADERLGRLLGRANLHGPLEHHEVYRAVALNYAGASDDARQAVVNAVLAHALPATGDWPAEKLTSGAHFDWLSWLLQAKPDCALAEAALAPIRAQYPDWRLSDHPDLTYCYHSGALVAAQSPWSVEQLLAREPDEQLDELLAFEGKRFDGPDRDGPDRDGLIATVREACKQQPRWGFALAQTLSERSLWSSDLWSAAISGWQEAELAVGEWREALTTTTRPELQAAQAYDIANLLYSLVRDGGKPFALDLLEQANAIALPLWQALPPNEQDEEIDDWLMRAINRPTGVVVELWISGLSLLMRGKSGDERTLPENYRLWLTMVVRDPSSKGGLGRSLLAGQAAFLYGLDEAWARQQVIPLFSDADQTRFAQAWDGFLVYGRLNPALADALMPAFVSALSRLGADPPERRRRFVEFYTALAVFHVDDPLPHLLPAFFQQVSTDDRISFASRLGDLLRHMDPAVRQQLWDRWLFRYWQGRLQSVPAALDEAEISTMVEWLPHLGDSFPAAVALAISSPRIRIEFSHVLFELRESDLVTRYPTETAKLLIYLCDCLVDRHATDLGTVAGRLPADLPADLRRRLDEALARVGANPPVA